MNVSLQYDTDFSCSVSALIINRLNRERGNIASALTRVLFSEIAGTIYILIKKSINQLTINAINNLVLLQLTTQVLLDLYFQKLGSVGIDETCFVYFAQPAAENHHLAVC